MLSSFWTSVQLLLILLQESVQDPTKESYFIHFFRSLSFRGGHTCFEGFSGQEQHILSFRVSTTGSYEEFCSFSQKKSTVTPLPLHSKKRGQRNFLYEFILPFESTEILQFFRVDTSFMGPSLNAPLSWRVDGIVSQTNSLSDPPFHVCHGDVIYQGIG